MAGSRFGGTFAVVETARAPPPIDAPGVSPTESLAGPRYCQEL